MTNREWLQTLTDEEFTKIILYSCECCIGRGNKKKCLAQPSCREGMLKWLKQEHKEDDNK